MLVFKETSWTSHTEEYTVASLQRAGITGYKSNHSLHATAATRLYRSRIDEQLVVERTGHRSLEGIRSYKRTSDSQREAVSDILNSKQPCTEIVPPFTTADESQVQQTQLPMSSTTNMQANIQNTIPGAFYFSSCSSITINVNQSK